MKILAYVDQGTGEIISTSSVSVSVPSHEDGAILDGHLIKDISFTGNSWRTFPQTHYWRGEWIERGERPSNFHSWSGTEWVFIPQALVNAVKSLRNDLLAQTDWTQVSDSPLSADMKNAWAGYRQELRDITDNLDGIESLDEVPWPDSP